MNFSKRELALSLALLILVAITIAAPRVRKVLVAQVAFTAVSGADLECVNPSNQTATVKIIGGVNNFSKKIRKNGSAFIELSGYSPEASLTLEIIQSKMAQRDGKLANCWLINSGDVGSSNLLNPSFTQEPNVSMLPVNLKNFSENILTLKQVSNSEAIVQIDIFKTSGKKIKSIKNVVISPNTNSNNIYLDPRGTKEINLAEYVNPSFLGAIKIRSISGDVTVFIKRSYEAATGKQQFNVLGNAAAPEMRAITSNIITLPPPPPPPPVTHLGCVGLTCSPVFGAGPDECDPADPLNECWYYTCDVANTNCIQSAQSVPDKADNCNPTIETWDCGHKECVSSFPFCAQFPGERDPSLGCDPDVETNDCKHTECDTTLLSPYFCVDKAVEGDNECDPDGEDKSRNCGHMECQNTTGSVADNCHFVGGEEADKCSPADENNLECKHKTCISNICTSVNGEGIDENCDEAPCSTSTTSTTSSSTTLTFPSTTTTTAIFSTTTFPSTTSSSTIPSSTTTFFPTTSTSTSVSTTTFPSTTTTTLSPTTTIPTTSIPSLSSIIIPPPPPPPPPPPVTHLGCVGLTCSPVFGAGPDDCDPADPLNDCWYYTCDGDNTNCVVAAQSSPDRGDDCNPTNNAWDCGHKDCVLEIYDPLPHCKQLPFEMPDQCDSGDESRDCKHTECDLTRTDAPYCIVRPNEGTNECNRDDDARDCGHLDCDWTTGGAPYCILKPGEGGNYCHPDDQNNDCAHKGCDLTAMFPPFCKLKPIELPDQCDISDRTRDCGHMKCRNTTDNELNNCRIVNGEGPDRCSPVDSLNLECRHKACVSGVCTELDGEGINENCNEVPCGASTTSTVPSTTITAPPTTSTSTSVTSTIFPSTTTTTSLPTTTLFPSTTTTMLPTTTFMPPSTTTTLSPSTTLFPSTTTTIPTTSTIIIPTTTTTSLPTTTLFPSTTTTTMSPTTTMFPSTSTTLPLSAIAIIEPATSISSTTFPLTITTTLPTLTTSTTFMPSTTTTLLPTTTMFPSTSTTFPLTTTSTTFPITTTTIGGSSSSSSGIPSNKYCDNIMGTCTIVGTGILCSNDTQCKHYGCTSGTCALVPGSGANECGTNPDCVKKICQTDTFNDRVCALAPGMGDDECSADSECGHKKCREGAVVCETVLDPGDDECSFDSECGHRECEGLGGSCRYVPGPGAHLCEDSGDCDNIDNVKNSIGESPLNSNGQKNYKKTNARARLLSGAINYGAINLTKTSIGSKNAPVVIKVYQDLKCSMCRYAYTEIIPLIVDEFVLENLVQIEFKEFPLTLKELEVALAEGAKCAGEQSKYMEYLKEVYRKDINDVSLIQTLAKDAGLDVDKFAQCVKSRTKKNEVVKDREEAKALGITATPTFIVNGEQIVGAGNYNKLREAIYNKLGKQN